ncbi:hypothetical protein [Arthrobacter sp. LAR12-1-1.1]|uniref:hypothetical protein n=1 Tax=Arthrobacter sp. LAR12-1-1.1 TaxID=3135215 RepID=UPI003447D8E1
MRQIVVSAIKSDKGLQFVRRYQRIVVFVSPICMASVILLLWLTSDGERRMTVLCLLPLLLGPPVMAWNIWNIGAMQAAHSWRSLATGQVLASLFAIIVGVPLVVVYANPFGASLGAVTVEIVMAIWCSVAAKGLPNRIDRRSDRSRKDYRTMAVYSGLAWGQGQTDRLFVGLVAGSHTLGVLSLGASLSRALGDAVASSNANLLRAELASAPASRAERLGTKVLLRGMILAAAAAVLTACANKWVLIPILSESWRPALEIVPLLCLSVVPSVLSWSAAVYHVRFNTGKRALIGPFVSIVIALPLSMLSLLSLQALGIGIVVREFVMVAVSYMAIGRRAPWQALYGALAITALLGAAVFTLDMI